MPYSLLSEARRRRRSRSKSLSSRSSRQDPILIDQSSATSTAQSQPAQDNALFNQAVTKLNEAVNNLPTIAVVKF